MRITLNPAAGFTRARFEIRYDQAAVGYSVNIGDSISNDGDGGDARDQSNDAELQILDNTVSVFASDYLVESRQDRLLAEWRSGIAVDPSTYVFEIADGSVRFEGFGDVNRPISLPWMGNRTEKVWSTSTSTPRSIATSPATGLASACATSR
ncbi:MAG: hypothetical protein R3A10_05105 [Caldilineaceae bacterium]